MNAQEQQLQTRLEATLARYIAMPTVTSNIPECQKAIKSLAGELESLGMAVHIDDTTHPWLIATANQHAHVDKKVKILLALHFDVVSPEDDSHFNVKMTKDKILGRGVIDMKFAAATTIEVLRDFAKEDLLNAYDVGVLITTDEEQGGYDGVRSFLDQGWRCDLAVVPDGGRDWNIEERAKGFLYVYLEGRGQSAHSSRTWEGNSPLPTFLPALQKIMAHFPNDDPSKTIVGVNTIETTNSGTLNSTQTPGWVKAGISIRAFTEEEMQGSREYIVQIAKEYGLTVTTTVQDAPVHMMHENKLVQQFIHSLKEVRGKPVGYSEALAASDARHFAAFDIPTAVIFPEGGNLHGAQEWVKRSDLTTFYTLTRHFLQAVAFTPENVTVGRARQLLKYKKVVGQLFKRASRKT